MTFFATYLGWLAALFTLALAHDLFRRLRPQGTGACKDALHTCLAALHDPDLLDAWAEVPASAWRDPVRRAEAAAVVRACVLRPACPIARADCMACLTALARHS